MAEKISAAIILAGGESRRMGEDKAKLKIEGETFLNKLVREFGDTPIIVSAAGNDSPKSEEEFAEYYEIDEDLKEKITWVSDQEEFTGSGPLAGIYSGMESLSMGGAGQEDFVCIAACDMPMLTRGVYEALKIKLEEKLEEKLDGKLDGMLEEKKTAAIDAVIPLDKKGNAHPLAGLYRIGTKETIRTQLKAGNRRVKDFLKTINTVYVPLDAESSKEELTNINEREDYLSLVKSGAKPSMEELIFLSLCLVMGMFGKKLISPVTNIVTDFIRLPGGGAAAAFSIMFLVIGAGVARWKFAGTVMGFIQGALSLFLGMGGYQGAFALITYTIPGLIIDLVRRFWPSRDKSFYAVACSLANSGNAFISNLLVFHFGGRLLLLWILVAASAGIIFGYLGGALDGRLSAAVKYRNMKRKAFSNIKGGETEMKKFKTMGRVVAAIILITTFITACTASKEAAKETEVAKETNAAGETNIAGENSADIIKIESSSVSAVVDISAIKDEKFSGTLVNGKGEEQEHSYKGMQLKDLLESVGVTVNEGNTITVTSSDNYSAEFTGEEILKDGVCYAAVEQDGEKIKGIDKKAAGVNIVVFGDPDSKRCVRYVERIEVKE